jgi:hypothetical protein
VLYVPSASELLLPVLDEVIPLQLLAYHIAVRRGCGVDQPRNLANPSQSSSADPAGASHCNNRSTLTSASAMTTNCFK